MRAVIQRVRYAKVEIEGQCVGSIGQGLLVLLGIEDADTDEDIEYLGKKLVALRIFADADGVMNLPIAQVEGSGILIVSQFTLMASTRKGSRPSYIRASKPDIAVPMYNKFVEKVRSLFAGKVATGRFGADMQVSLLNDGPVTICIDTKNR